ncbi:YdaU family protein [Martelella radicis]|uniref:Uncharacterized protein YdaU (DUF1376 family) n=1 Tax=Martelella radicis TaxID=1397476 RepID=A0A7W6P8V9_9HYPH|nr:DUF1376 domain-containing protein [Martelella radicis]MBB4120716.1 uncharacterized protein YdaU (DUF1376 family) [Martelella radicis]
MSEMPYVRFYMSDWLSATRGMKAAEMGVYFTLLALMYERGEPLTENHERLARQCGCTKKVFSQYLDVFLDDGKIIRSGGGLWNRRVEKEFQFREKSSEDKKQAAKKRWKKSNENNEASMQVHSTCNAAAMLKPEARVKKESVPKGTPKKSPKSVLCDVLSPEVADAVIEHRKALRKKLTVRAAELLARRFALMPDPDAAAETMIGRGWQGFEPGWVQERQQGAPRASPAKPSRGDEIRDHNQRARDSLRKRMGQDDGSEDRKIIDISRGDWKVAQGS